jgi:hypothetical protein
MDARRSFYLKAKKNDFAELAPKISRPDPDSIPYIPPANDNVPARMMLASRCRSLLLRLIAMHDLSSDRIDTA